ncbi:MAG: hypothetical protein KatS3mg105_4727 [Gemmatales bacterium]|nr:MAG: hypothetical protein KatS3mg105_4727 [Gemmatales bacterium]
MNDSTIKLADIAHARSGDKGNHANIAVLAYTDAGYAWLRDNLTAERIAEFLRPKALPGRVVRYVADNVRALNFVLYDFLDGGASLSPNIDSQGKALGLAVLQMDLPRPSNVDAMRRPTPST